MSGTQLEYDGPLTMIRLRVGMDVPVAMHFDEVTKIIQGSDDWFVLPSVTSSEIGFCRADITMWSPAQITREHKPAIEVPQRQLLVPS